MAASPGKRGPHIPRKEPVTMSTDGGIGGHALLMQVTMLPAYEGVPIQQLRPQRTLPRGRFYLARWRKARKATPNSDRDRKDPSRVRKCRAAPR